VTFAVSYSKSEEKRAFSRTLAELCHNLLHYSKGKLKVAFGFKSQMVGPCRSESELGGEPRS